MLTDRAQIIALLNLPDKAALIPAGFFAEHIRLAKRSLRKWVGASAYDAAEAEIQAAITGLEVGETLADVTLTEETDCLRLAEACLSIEVSYPAINMVYGGAGIVLTEYGTDGTSRRIANPNEIELMQKKYRKQAISVAGPYLETKGLVPRIVTAKNPDGTSI